MDTILNYVNDRVPTSMKHQGKRTEIIYIQGSANATLSFYDTMDIEIKIVNERYIQVKYYNYNKK